MITEILRKNLKSVQFLQQLSQTMLTNRFQDVHMNDLQIVEDFLHIRNSRSEKFIADDKFRNEIARRCLQKHEELSGCWNTVIKFVM